jgi:hypothetical protein
VKTVSINMLIASALLAVISVSSVSASQRPTCPRGEVWNGDARRCERRIDSADQRVQRCAPGEVMRSGRCMPICAIGIVNSCKKGLRP